MPAPPDVRKIVIEQDEKQDNLQQVIAAQAPVTASPQIRQLVESLMIQINNSVVNNNIKDNQQVVNVARETISPANTTIIGDYVAGCFGPEDNKWLVQVVGNETLQSVAWKIQHDVLIIQRRYIFLLIGHNQLWTATKGTIQDAVAEIVDEIRCRNPAAHIYFSTLLPRPIDNIEAKPKIVKFNRNLFQAVKKVQQKFTKVQLLSVQHQFIVNSAPDVSLFNTDRLTLNTRVAQRLKSALFTCTGFRVNDNSSGAIGVW